MSARKKMGLPLQMGIGMVLGILVGTLAPKLGISAAFFKPFGDLFINLVRMVVVPLVLATLVSGAASVGDVGRSGPRGRQDAGLLFPPPRPWPWPSALSWAISSSPVWGSTFPPPT